MAKILVAEDDALLVRAIRDALELDGHHVCAVVNGVQALEAFGHFRPDLIVTDVVMPEMDGLELYRRVRCELSGAAVPFVFISGWEPVQIGEQGDRHSTFLKKPFGLEEMLEIVRKLLSWRARPSAPPGGLSLARASTG